MNDTKKIRISYSAYDTAKQCGLRHQLAYKERWRSDESAPALSRGTAMHAALEHHYRRLQQYDPTSIPAADFNAATRALAVADDIRGVDTEEGEAVDFMVDGYVDYYGADSNWEILAVEVDFEVPLFDHFGKESEFELIGRIDLIVKNRGTGKVWVVDHKSASQMPTEKALEFDSQLALYTIAARRAGFPVHGAIYNVLRSKKLKRAMTPEERFSRKLVVSTVPELDTTEHEVVQFMRDVYRDRGGLDAPRSPDSERCSWKCNYREACLMGRKNGNERARQFLKDTGFRQPDPPAATMLAPAEPGQMDLLTELERIKYDPCL